MKKNQKKMWKQLEIPWTEKDQYIQNVMNTEKQTLTLKEQLQKIKDLNKKKNYGNRNQTTN